MQHQSNLYDVVEAIKILSPGAFSFAGKTVNVNANVFYPANGSTPADPLVRSLTDTLYQQCYCRTFSGAYYEAPAVTPDSGMFQSTLSRANSTIERWDKDWIVEQVLPTGQYVACKNNKYKFLFPGEFVTANYQSASPQPGTRITIQCPKESAGLPSAFYFVFSNEMTDQQNLYTLVRFYWNVKSTGAARLIELLTKELNRYSIPFSFKCLNNPAVFTRSDAAVLYIARPYYRITARILAAVHPEMKDELKEDIPAFTKRLASGLALAEDPATGESFGMSRCGMLAQALCDAHRAGDSTSKQVMQQIEKTFESKKLQLAMPYLNAGTRDIYEFND